MNDETKKVFRVEDETIKVSFFKEEIEDIIKELNLQLNSLIDRRDKITFNINKLNEALDKHSESDK